MCVSTMMVMCNKQHLATCEAEFMKKLMPLRLSYRNIVFQLSDSYLKSILTFLFPL